MDPAFLPGYLTQVPLIRPKPNVWAGTNTRPVCNSANLHL
jgi:hypothetical protein